MSLLNDMLRDLARQHKSDDPLSAGSYTNPDFIAQEQPALFHQASTLRRLLRVLLLSLTAFVLVLAIAWGWRYWAGMAAKIPVPHDIIEPAASIAASSSIDATVKHQVQVDSELVARLAALEIAVTGLADAVTDKTTSTVDKDFIAKDSFDADPPDRALQTSVSVKPPVIAEQNQVDSHSLNDIQTLTHEPTHLSIAPNSKWQDAEHARQARELVAQGQLAMAIEKLQQFIASEQQPRESVRLLLDINIDQGNLIEAQQWLTGAHYLLPVEQIYYQAKILVGQEREDQAIPLLETHLNSAENDENYRALLAGLYQKNGDPLAAASHYRRLLATFGDKPAYWLGFALSQDALNQPQVALQAFQRVNQYADLPPQVRTYIQQRLAALQQ